MRHKLVIIHPFISACLTIAFILVQLVVINSVRNNKVLGISFNLDAKEIIKLTNQERQKNKLPLLNENEKTKQLFSKFNNTQIIN